MKNYLVITAAVIVLAACKDKAPAGDCFMAAGKDDERKITPGDFYEITVGDRFVVELKQDTALQPLITVKGGANVIKNVSAVAVNGKLEIKDENICNWTRDFSRKIKIEIRCRKLNGLFVTDAGEIASSDTILSDSMVIYQRSTGTLNMAFKAGKLEVNHEAHGQVNLKGIAAVFVPVVFSAGGLDARHLQGDYTFAYHYGINDMHVKPWKVLYVLVGNSGNTYYYADPFEQPLKTTLIGSGKVERK